MALSILYSNNWYKYVTYLCFVKLLSLWVIAINAYYYYIFFDLVKIYGGALISHTGRVGEEEREREERREREREEGGARKKGEGGGRGY